MKITDEQAQEMLDACNDLRIPIKGKDVALEWYANQLCLELHERGYAPPQGGILKEEDFKDGGEVFSYNMREDDGNWERAKISASGGVMTVKMEAAGTGTIRKVFLYPEVYEGLPNDDLPFYRDAPGSLKIDTSNGESFLVLVQERGVTRYTLDYNGISRWYDPDGKEMNTLEPVSEDEARELLEELGENSHGLRHAAEILTGFVGRKFALRKDLLEQILKISWS